MKAQILSLLGFNPNSVNHLDGASRNQMIFAAFTVLLVASLSALLFATTISRLCFNGNYFWPIAGAWFLFMYFLEALVLGADIRNKTVMFIRLAICIVLAAFHSLTLDTFAFSNDIHNYLTEEYNSAIENLNNAIDSEKETLTEKQADFIARNRELSKMEKASWYRVDEEVNEGAEGRMAGYEEHAKFKEKTYKKDSILFAHERTANNNQIEEIDSSLAALDAKLKAQKETLLKPESAGLLDNVNALHKLVWGSQGTFMDRFYFVLVMLLGLLFESLVLISKLSFRKSFGAYQDEVDADRSSKSSLQEARRIMETEAEEMEITKEFKTRHSKLRKEIDLLEMKYQQELSKEKAEMRFRKVKEEADMIFEAIKDVDRMDQEIKKDLNGYYSEYGIPLVTDVRLDKIKTIAKDLKASKP